MNYLKEKIKQLVNKRKFYKINRHNNVSYGCISDINRLSIGFHTYGEINLKAYSSIGKNILSIGNYVSIASNVHFLLDENHQMNTLTTFPLKTIAEGKSNPLDCISSGDIIIEDEVWIGINSIILSGSHIRKGSIISAGSVVKGSYPSYSLIRGNPAKLIRKRFSERIIKYLDNHQIDTKIEKIDIGLYYKEINEDNIADIVYKNRCIK